jgi:hypothetical protein
MTVSLDGVVMGLRVWVRRHRNTRGLSIRTRGHYDPRAQGGQLGGSLKSAP